MTTIGDKADVYLKVMTEIESELQKSSLQDKANGFAYAYAYGRLIATAKEMILDLRECDPAYGLQVMTYDEIVSREA